MEQKISQAERILSYTFTDKVLCAEAIQMAAPQALFPLGGQFRLIENNKRLAVLGDITLANALCKMWYSARDSAGKHQPMSAWTELRNDLLGNSQLARRCAEIGLGECIVKSNGAPGPAGPNMLATTLEALFGAIYEDGGGDAVLRVMAHVGIDQHPVVMIPYMDNSGIILRGRNRSSVSAR